MFQALDLLITHFVETCGQSTHGKLLSIPPIISNTILFSLPRLVSKYQQSAEVLIQLIYTLDYIANHFLMNIKIFCIQSLVHTRFPRDAG